MTKQSPNEQFRSSSFMQGQNATYLEHLYAQFVNDPNAVDAAWQEFFVTLGDTKVDVKKEAQGASWSRTNWPPLPSDDLTLALDGIWAPTAERNEVERKIIKKAAKEGVKVSDDALKRAVLDSIRALMIIRAFRIRGHLEADLDPLDMREKNETH